MKTNYIERKVIRHWWKRADVIEPAFQTPHVHFTPVFPSFLSPKFHFVLKQVWVGFLSRSTERALTNLAEAKLLRTELSRIRVSQDFVWSNSSPGTANPVQHLHHTTALETPEDSLPVPLDRSQEAQENKTNQSTKRSYGDSVYEVPGCSVNHSWVRTQLKKQNLRGIQVTKESRIQSNFHPKVLSIILPYTVFLSPRFVEKICRQHV